jgi:hypothetical protein
MPGLHRIIAAVAGSVCFSIALSQNSAAVSPTYKALIYIPESFGTWGILDRDGASRPVAPYLSSLAAGEFGTGVVVSPPFTLGADAVTFTICGHDGQGGGQQKNYIALRDDKTGEVLRKTMAPGSDPMQSASWDVAELKGRAVRIEVRDEIAAGGFAWLGIGKIDAGPSLAIDFSKGMPAGWKVTAAPAERRTEIVRGGIPFLRTQSYTMLPPTGSLEIPCGFTAERLYFLGATVGSGRPLETYGTIEIAYRTAPSERYPLLYGFTLDGEYKLLSPSKALYLHPSGDPFRYYFVIGVKPDVIEKITFTVDPAHQIAPRITAVTCQTPASAENLEPLPDCRPGDVEEAWIRAHTITPMSPNIEAIMAEIQRAHQR